MLLFASRPLDTYFSNSPIGWYLYNWHVGTNPNFVEFGNAETKVFLLIHGLLALVMFCCVVWMVWLWYLQKMASAREIAAKEHARNPDDAAFDKYKKAVEAQKKIC
jgi:hypothetical protein